MMRLINILTIIAMLGLFFIGCEKSPNPVEPQSSLVSGALSTEITIPYGATLESAKFYIYANIADGQTVDLQRVTNGWDEYSVTWNSFGAAYAPNIYGSFVADAVGWKWTDITALVQEWMDGTYDNHGFVMLQNEDMSAISRFDSRENTLDYKPYLEICYTTETGIVCETTLPVADTYISESAYNNNYGTHWALYTGWISDYEKQSLIKFEFDQAMPDPAEIGDIVWIDNNRDGIQDEGEPGFPDVLVELYNCQDEMLASMLTDENGYYLFTGLMPGDYYVKFIKPEGYEFTLQDVGDDALDSDVDPATGMDVCTNLESGESDMTHDAGLYLREMEGCSLTIGFWKNHGGFGPQADVVTPLLPIWLGDPSGDESIYVDNGQLAHDILTQKVYGTPSNAITKMMAQMLAAKLNIANGAAGSVIGSEISDADEFLADYSWMDWDDLSNNMKKIVRKLHSTFDDYNNGDIGPGHCDNFGDDED